MKIGVLTFHRSFNCGAMLQAWATKIVLQRLGHSVSFASDLENRGGKRWCAKCPIGRSGWRKFRGEMWALLANAMSIGVEDLTRARYNRFRRKYLLERVVASEHMHEMYDLAWIGSDMVWCPGAARGSLPRFLGEGFASSIKLASYAASAGDDRMPDALVRRIQAFARRAVGISVRENGMREQLEPVLGCPVDVTVDPTLLLDAHDYDPIIAGPIPTEPYLFYYTLNLTEHRAAMAKRLAKRLGVKLVMTSVYQYTLYQCPKGVTFGVSPDRFLQYVKHAKYVLAASFHGTVFALLYKKPFVTIDQKGFVNTRCSSLLTAVACQDRMVRDLDNIDIVQEILSRPLPPDLTDKLHQMRRSSLDYIRRVCK